MRTVTAQRHGRKSLAGGEATRGQLTQDQLTFGISLAYLFCGSGLAFPAGLKSCSRNMCFDRKTGVEREWKLLGSQFKRLKRLLKQSRWNVGVGSRGSKEKIVRKGIEET